MNPNCPNELEKLNNPKSQFLRRKPKLKNQRSDKTHNESQEPTSNDHEEMPLAVEQIQPI